jgi:leucyl aminopeptidase
MKVTVETGDPRPAKVDMLAVPMVQHDRERWRLPARIGALDRALGGAISSALKSGDFRGRPNESVMLYPTSESGPRRVLLQGLGEATGVDAQTLRRAAGTAITLAASKRAETVALLAPSAKRLRAPASAQALAEGGVLGSFRFDAYRMKKENGPIAVKRLRLFYERLASPAPVRAAASTGVILAESQNLARRLSNEPANALPPAALAREARKTARESGLAIRVMDVAELRRRKMGAILAVGMGSSNPPRLIVLEHNPARLARGKGGADERGGAGRGRDIPTVCVVGKGITFDSGGISIKPAGGMQDMKHDMSGAAAVVGVLRAAALLKLPIRVVGVIAAAENMPSGSAYRPGDVLRSMSGQTIEVVNTDAEGRVVLADALHFAKIEYSPRAILDMATLTGACTVALGPWATGIFGNHDGLVERIRQAGEAAGERAWPMPLLEEHREAVRSSIADLRNTAAREGGASTAAGFLAAFVGETPWVHLDIAGTGWTEKAGPFQPRGATGVGVRMILELLRSWKTHPPV